MIFPMFFGAQYFFPILSSMLFVHFTFNEGDYLRRIGIFAVSFFLFLLVPNLFIISTAFLSGGGCENKEIFQPLDNYVSFNSFNNEASECVNIFYVFLYYNILVFLFLLTSLISRRFIITAPETIDLQHIRAPVVFLIYFVVSISGQLVIVNYFYTDNGILLLKFFEQNIISVIFYSLFYVALYIRVNGFRWKKR